MGKIGCGYGSEWHLLRYLGYHRNYLSQKILNITGGENISWLDFRFSKKYAYLNNDREHVGIEFIKDRNVINKWKQFWPQTGTLQNWDAVGKIIYEDHEEWLLVEAKAHLSEVKSGCGAKSQASKDLIKAALKKTASAFCEQSPPIENWFSPYYQYANRLAVLYFLMKECDPDIPARLLFLYFYGDHRDDAQCPQGEDDWCSIMSAIRNRLVLDRNDDLNKRIHHLFLPVNPLENINNGQSLILRCN